MRTIIQLQIGLFAHVLRKGQLEHLSITGKFDRPRAHGRQPTTCMEWLARVLGYQKLISSGEARKEEKNVDVFTVIGILYGTCIDLLISRMFLFWNTGIKMKLPVEVTSLFGLEAWLFDAIYDDEFWCTKKHPGIQIKQQITFSFYSIRPCMISA